MCHVCLFTIMNSKNRKSLKTSKGQVKDVKDKSQLFLNDRKNANCVLDIASSAESDDSDVVLACVQAFHKIFSTLITNQEMFLEKLPQPEDMEDLTKEEKLKMWYKERYDEARLKLFEFLVHENENIRELSLCTLMKLVKAEGVTPLVKMAEKNIWFPAQFFQKVMMTLLNSEADMTSLIARFQEFLEYDDVRYYSMKTALHATRDTKQEGDNGIFLANVFAVLDNLSMPSSAPEDDRLTNFLSRVPDTAGLKVNTLREHKKLFSTLWLDFLKHKLPVGLYKKVLVILHDKVMPHMINPRLLTDFLTFSYDVGGAISLLALNGVFVLVNQYNLDYPEFYKKLYALFEPSVFHVKYRARFFYLADLFLTSSHIPAYLVAAFIKRLSRLALTAPPHGLTVLLPFIFNLVRRHPNCEVLVQNTNGPTDLTIDPYKMNELDPAKCDALKSSLWELKTIQEHFHHSVSKEARGIEHEFGPMEADISGLLETSIDDLIDKERKKKVKTVAMTYDAPTGLFSNTEDQLSQFWTWKEK